MCSLLEGDGVVCTQPGNILTLILILRIAGHDGFAALDWGNLHLFHRDTFYRDVFCWDVFCGDTRFASRIISNPNTQNLIYLPSGDAMPKPDASANTTVPQ